MNNISTICCGSAAALHYKQRYKLINMILTRCVSHQARRFLGHVIN